MLEEHGLDRYHGTTTPPLPLGLLSRSQKMTDESGERGVIVEVPVRVTALVTETDHRPSLSAA